MSTSNSNRSSQSPQSLLKWKMARTEQRQPQACVTGGMENSLFWPMSAEIGFAAICSMNYCPSGTGGGSTYASTCIPNKAFKAKNQTKQLLNTARRNNLNNNKKNILHFDTKKQKVGGLSSVIQCYKDSITSWYMDESDEGRRLLVLKHI